MCKGLCIHAIEAHLKYRARAMRAVERGRPIEIRCPSPAPIHWDCCHPRRRRRSRDSGQNGAGRSDGNNVSTTPALVLEPMELLTITE